ncbi:hypothetical protein, partial [Escherichia coli]|uniref:hypothetical protein n=1 Tax=Escherichia coli TaxID=562 RepID=UPI002915F705
MKIVETYNDKHRGNIHIKKKNMPLKELDIDTEQQGGYEENASLNKKMEVIMTQRDEGDNVQDQVALEKKYMQREFERQNIIHKKK